jgi:hypothetical protein
MRILPLLIASAVVFYSCDKKESSTEKTQEITASTSKSDNVLEDTIPANVSAEITEVDQNSVPSTGPTATPFPAEVSKSNGKPALNPAHGQPYHRCEIAVGAPLNNTSQQNTAPQTVGPQQNSANSTINTTPVPTFQVPANATGTKPALNPAHGQPYHRCELAVGAPLS